MRDDGYVFEIQSNGTSKGDYYFRCYAQLILNEYIIICNNVHTHILKILSENNKDYPIEFETVKKICSLPIEFKTGF